MKKVALKIINAHRIYAKTKIEDLDEKRLVPKMMMRRRLTRNAKVMIYLSDKCDFKDGKVVYGSCYSELEETSKIADAVICDAPLSPTSFQNSVYNTAPSYFSLLEKDKDEIITISSGSKTSLDTLKTAALQALVSRERILCVAIECINIKNIDEINRCTGYLEAGVGVVLEIDDKQDDAKELQSCKMVGIIDSLRDLMGVVEMYENNIDKILVEL
ncbi:MAG: beta-ketoacyl synthase chain length factor [Epsilonproteobacteria bacterium]|nr:beta-ketoacyl synthase chain length factor [Campylobacterota bacterium]